MAPTATKLFQRLTQLSVQTHLNTDKARLTLFKQQTKKQKEKGAGGRAGDWGEGINWNLEHQGFCSIYLEPHL